MWKQTETDNFAAAAEKRESFPSYWAASKVLVRGAELLF